MNPVALGEDHKYQALYALDNLARPTENGCEV